IDGSFFYTYSRIQGLLAYLLAAFVSPGLISWDISNGALQLYFCRPFSRIEYVFGKLTVLLPLLAIITWLPAIVLFAIKVSVSGLAWTKENWWLGVAAFFGLFMWTVVVALIGLALSASV